MKYVFALLAIIVLAIGGPCAAYDLSAAVADCDQHVKPNSMKYVGATIYNKGWEHCDILVEAYTKQKADAMAAEEAVDPALKMSRELAKELKRGK